MIQGRTWQADYPDYTAGRFREALNLKSYLSGPHANLSVGVSKCKPTEEIYWRLETI